MISLILNRLRITSKHFLMGNSVKRPSETVLARRFHNVMHPAVKTGAAHSLLRNA